MSDTRVLLGKIVALRQRLEQAQGLANEARSAAAALIDESSAGDRTRPRLAVLQRLATDGGEHDLHLDRLVRPLTASAPAPGEEPRTMPRQLSARARRVLERGRDLLQQLRPLADAFPPDAAVDPLARLYRETVSLTDTALRIVPLFPDATSAQLHLSAGLEAVLDVAAARLRTVSAGVEGRRQEERRIARLAELLSALAARHAIELSALMGMAEEVLSEAQAGEPLRFLAGDPTQPVHFAACHGWTVARVVARVVRHDPELRGRAAEAVAAALLHDIGMIEVPASVLAQAGPLTDEQRRQVEAHCQAGVLLAAPLLPNSPWLAAAILKHHERLDGTGYPGGLREFHLEPLPRLLAVCDVYVALCSARPHRPARETRTALADTLLLAEQGQLDRHYSECLLHLSFYPVGTVVELADGAVGVVVAAPGMGDLNSPARPVVAVLTSPQGQPLPLPQHLDLAECEGHSIVRSLSREQSREVLGERFAEWLVPAPSRE
jgi:hypothetical protein